MGLYYMCLAKVSLCDFNLAEALYFIVEKSCYFTVITEIVCKRAKHY